MRAPQSATSGTMTQVSQPATSTTDQFEGIVVTSEVTADGYEMSVSFGPDQTVPLPRDAAIAYAMTVLAACTRAEYAAAMVAQMHGRLAMPIGEVAGIVGEWRMTLPPPDDTPTAPMRVAPAVSAATYEPYLEVHIDGVHVGDWRTSEARSHAFYVLEGVEAATANSANWQMMTGADLPARIAHAVTADLSDRVWTART